MGSPSFFWWAVSRALHTRRNGADQINSYLALALLPAYTVPVKSLDTFSHVSKLLTSTVHTHAHIQIHTQIHTHTHTHSYTHRHTHRYTYRYTCTHKQNTGWQMIMLFASRTVPVNNVDTFPHWMFPNFWLVLCIKECSFCNYIRFECFYDIVLWLAKCSRWKRTCVSVLVDMVYCSVYFCVMKLSV